MKVFHMLGNGDDGKLKQRVRVEFVNAEGLTEAGVDGMINKKKKRERKMN